MSKTKLKICSKCKIEKMLKNFINPKKKKTDTSIIANLVKKFTKKKTKRNIKNIIVQEGERKRI